MKKCYIERLNKEYKGAYGNPFEIFKEDPLPAEFEGVCWYNPDLQLPLSEHLPVRKDYYTKLIGYIEKRMRYCEELYIHYLQRGYTLRPDNLVFHKIRLLIDRVLRGIYIEHPEIKNWGLLILGREEMEYRESRALNDTLRELEKKKKAKVYDPYFTKEDYEDIPDIIKIDETCYYDVKERCLMMDGGKLIISLGEFIIGWYDDIIDKEEWIMRYRKQLLIDNYEHSDIQELYNLYCWKVNIETADDLFNPENLKALSERLLGDRITDTFPYHARLLFTITHQ